jgi:hypothetical protein
MTGLGYLSVILSFGAIASFAAAEEKEVTINLVHLRPAYWRSAKIDVVSADQHFVGQLATQREGSRLKYLIVRPARSHGERTMAIPVDLFKSIENPRIESIGVSAGSSSNPLLIVTMKYGNPVRTSTLTCSADLLPNKFAFAWVKFGFDFGTRTVDRILMDPCDNRVDESGEIAVK